MSSLAQRLQFTLDHRRVPGQMSAYLDGDLGARGRTRVERHTGRCPACRQLLQGLRERCPVARPVFGARRPAQLVSAVRASLREPGG